MVFLVCHDAHILTQTLNKNFSIHTHTHNENFG